MALVSFSSPSSFLTFTSSNETVPPPHLLTCSSSSPAGGAVTSSPAPPAAGESEGTCSPPAPPPLLQEALSPPPPLPQSQRTNAAGRGLFPVPEQTNKATVTELHQRLQLWDQRKPSGSKRQLISSSTSFSGGGFTRSEELKTFSKTNRRGARGSESSSLTGDVTVCAHFLHQSQKLYSSS